MRSRKPSLTAIFERRPERKLRLTNELLDAKMAPVDFNMSLSRQYVSLEMPRSRAQNRSMDHNGFIIILEFKHAPAGDVHDRSRSLVKVTVEKNINAWLRPFVNRTLFGL
ncbi:hypothetical protein AVEN_72724-1 [Araneus ventricosus]|uniref:Uncharacterized protein n=1 Tax=Araneus ventricosus TaxID=182803 RepID=A0A4Y2DQD0_ARAVE|nr:hypothetical protein AVEN_72724-1 [Araneus ventricosus]